MAVIPGFIPLAVVSISTAIALAFIMGFFGGNKFNVKGKTILLTGASEGMGKCVAIMLAQRGANVIIVARNVGKLEAALVDIKAASTSSSQRFHYISADLSAPNASSRVIDEATKWNSGQAPDTVWCVAGSAHPSLFLETDLSVMRSQMDTNFWSCNDMAHTILARWLAPSAPKGEHHLIFTSSVVAFYSLAGYAAYAPGKAAIKSLSDTLAQEMLLYGDEIKIHTIFPGTINTAGYEVENKTKPEITQLLEASDPVQSPEVVARRSVEGLERGDYLVTVGWLGDLMRASAWGGSKRNNWVIDILVSFVASIVCFFVGMDLDGKVKKHRKDKGPPQGGLKSL